AGLDSTNFQLASTIASLQSEICEAYVNALTLLKLHDGAFMRVPHMKVGYTIVHSHNGILFTPRCELIDEVEIDTTTGKCFKDLPVIIEKGNSSLKLFLTKDRIIKKQSETISCDNLLRYWEV